jgi:hypothetical protein
LIKASRTTWSLSRATSTGENGLSISLIFSSKLITGIISRPPFILNLFFKAKSLFSTKKRKKEYSTLNKKAKNQPFPLYPKMLV